MVKRYLELKSGDIYCRQYNKIIKRDALLDVLDGLPVTRAELVRSAMDAEKTEIDRLESVEREIGQLRWW